MDIKDISEQLNAKFENKEGVLATIDCSKSFEDGLLVIGLTETPHSFLQNLTRLKSELYKRGLTFKPIVRLLEFAVIMRIVKKGTRKKCHTSNIQ